MEAYKRGSHTVLDCKYRVVWVTKYRHPVLGGELGNDAENCCVRRPARATMCTCCYRSHRARRLSRGAAPEGKKVAQAAERVRLNATGVSTCGRGATGSRAAARSLTRLDCCFSEPGNSPVTAPPLLGALATTVSPFGWTAGSGVEFAISPNGSVKAEYLYVDFPKRNSRPRELQADRKRCARRRELSLLATGRAA
jgi:hypothetical protein